MDGKNNQTTNYISLLMNILVMTLLLTSFLWGSVCWCMYSVITSEMRLYDGNWWQPVVLFRWLMMRVSLRGSRSKQLIYTVRHSSQRSILRSNSLKVFLCVLMCMWVFVWWSTQGGKGGLWLIRFQCYINTSKCSVCPVLTFNF